MSPVTLLKALAQIREFFEKKLNRLFRSSLAAS